MARQAPLSMGFSRQEYWSGLPFPSPGDLPNPGMEPRSPALQAVLHRLSHWEVQGGKVRSVLRLAGFSNELMLLASTWMDLGIITLSEVVQTKTNITIFICEI